MNEMKYKYFIFRGINDLEYLTIDRVRKVICTIKNGKYNNETKKCQTIYEKDKLKSWDKRRVGYNWIKCLITGYKDGILDDLILKTNSLKDFDLKCMELRKNQIEFMLKRLSQDKEKLLKNKQYYTYAFSNLDYTTGEDSLNKKYFKEEIEKENILDDIIKPKYYEDKEQECTICDEEYDYSTTFYYIEKPKDNYEKFIKHLSENLIVKSMNGNTLTVGITDFINDNKEKFVNIFGEQDEEIYVKNIISMIDGNATESCYTDFNSEFKINYEFNFCNGHTFEELKEKSIEDLDYEKVHDLAIVENRNAHISACLGVYDNKFQLTFSIHGQENFDENFINLKAIPVEVSIKDIKNKEELEDVMKSKLKDFYNKSSGNIEILSRKLDEDENNIAQDETEELEE